MSDNQNDTTRTMADVSHSNPYTGRRAGHLFHRGPTVAADGGEEAAAEGTDDESETERTMAEVDHTPPHDAEDANRVFERGTRSVEGEE
ncbi:hypothetical protein [Natronolimnobius baerhuensis]|uniref:Uncharacterized protein n=1 Tax=Natronolimnobius baerhuensis TaxID=253108 RepID=A0A202ECA6_9EURY|nr:hypothetical protein [Natronolimnobius baerhuensis]OVE85862.1 hypothetical protein B2G88_03350 [Natronolimnobius baerhuensis]